MPAYGTIVGGSSEAQMFFCVPDWAITPGMIEGIAIEKHEFALNDKVIIIQIGEEFGFLPKHYERWTPGVLNVPDRHKESMMMQSPFHSICAYIANRIGRVEQLYWRGIVTEIWSFGTLRLRMIDGPLAQQDNYLAGVFATGFTANDFKVGETVILQRWGMQNPVVIGWWKPTEEKPLGRWFVSGWGVSVNANNVLSVSADSQTWDPVQINGITEMFETTMAYGADRIVMSSRVASLPSVFALISMNTDYEDVQINFFAASGSIAAVKRLAGRFVYFHSGATLVSSDGKDWEPHPPAPFNFSDNLLTVLVDHNLKIENLYVFPVYDAGSFTNGTLWGTANGVNWQIVRQFLGWPYLLRSGDSAQFESGTSVGLGLTSDRNSISQDMTSWQQFTIGGGGRARVYSAHDLMYASNEGAHSLYMSQDSGASWAQAADKSPSQIFRESCQQQGMAYDPESESKMAAVWSGYPWTADFNHTFLYHTPKDANPATEFSLIGPFQGRCRIHHI